MEYVTQKPENNIQFHEDKDALRRHLLKARADGDTEAIEIFQVIDGHALHLGTDQGDYTPEQLIAAAEMIPAW